MSKKRKRKPPPSGLEDKGCENAWGGLSSTAAIPSDELDRFVERLALADPYEWVGEYLKKAERRKKKRFTAEAVSIGG